MPVVSSIIGAVSSSHAADVQAAASKYAAKIQKQIYMQQRQDLMPFMKSAERMLPVTEKAMIRAERLGQEFEWQAKDYERMFANGPGAYERSDYYKDMQGTIDYGIEKAAREMGTASSASGAGYGRDLMNYAVPMASEAYKTGRGNFINEWISTKLNPSQTLMAQYGGASLPQNAGMNAIPSFTAAGSNYANNASANAIYGGQAKAAGILGQGQAIQQGIGGAANALGLFTGLGGFGNLGLPGLKNLGN
jgi:hypothetical protein